ncbi:unnamed protein product [Medioppia subpectinata]|uniref:Uncharacterized protein n=1 Tax=Medioppia subpectinata TaxID=1979941 RepID=A0A7R9LD51_9ACAR|nr:unnamed protein product [Medioppia subpectinata]CAG2117869.1 unnamed protein product [Medioppia subpectinata]
MKHFIQPGSAIPLICMGILELRYHHDDLWAPILSAMCGFVMLCHAVLIAMTMYGDPGWHKFYGFIRNSLYRPFGFCTDTSDYQPI